MRRPRLVHLTTTDMSLALLLGPQLRAFAAAGFEVIGASAPGPYVDELRSWGIRHVPVRHATRSMAPHRDARALAELRSLFVALRPDVVHTHNPKPGVYGRLAARAARVPAIVNTVHGLYAVPEDRWSKRAVVYGLEHLAARCSHAELVQNPEDIGVLADIGVALEKVHFLGNGIDLHRFDPRRRVPERVARLRAELTSGPDDVLCAAVGRLVWEKGYREIFAAAARLRRRVPALRIVVVGPSDPAKADAVTSADIERATVEGGVHFLGERRDVEDLYAAMDLYVLASHREGFPRSAMEAASMGLPVVATAIRGCRQVVDHGVTGLLVPPRDDRALEEGLATVAGDADLRVRMSAAARRKALAEFDHHRVIDVTLGVYDRLLGQSSARTARAAA